MRGCNCGCVASARRIDTETLRDCEGEVELPLRVVEDITVWTDDYGTATDVRTCRLCCQGILGIMSMVVQASVLLFPSKDSMSAHEFLSSLRAKRPRVDPDEPALSTTAVDEGCTPASNRRGPSIHLMVVDGTWTQAKKMCKALSAKVPCIRIDVDDHTSTLYTPLRKVRLSFAVTLRWFVTFRY